MRYELETILNLSKQRKNRKTQHSSVSNLPGGKLGMRSASAGLGGCGFFVKDVELQFLHCIEVRYRQAKKAWQTESEYMNM